MNLRSKSRISADFNMSSMTDVVFLLLIFFMLTSSFVTPTAVPVSLPTSSTAPPIVIQRISVTITKDLQYFLNEKPTTMEQMRPELAGLLQGVEEGVVVLNIDKTVPVEHLVKVAGIANDLKAKVSIAAVQE
ncbi:biopolymer transporter ExbD [soil metagenome]